MNKVDQRVRKNMAAYPGLFDNRFDVLHHIFCVLGNGYRWVNGEPVERYPDAKAPWTPEHEYATWSKHAETMPRWSEVMFEEIAEKQAVIDTLDERVADGSFSNSRQAIAAVEMAKVMGAQYGPLYPQSEYALLMNLPADIHPDWVQAAEEMRTQAWLLGWNF